MTQKGKPQNDTKLKKGKVTKSGVCALLGKEGVFVKSHLIPQALTGPDTPGKHFIEAGPNTRPVKRFTSWYDDELVIREGEDYLSRIDSRAVAELRRNKLVWSGWGKDKILKCPHHSFSPETKDGFRSLPGVDTSLLRLYFISLLWRALSTERSEFQHLTTAGVDIIRLRDMILSGESGSSFYHPIILHQMNTRGITHNYTPVMWDIVIPTSEQGSEINLKTYRFYMQGLIAHIYPTTDETTAKRLGGLPLGAQPETFIFTRPFNTSAQLTKMQETARQIRSRQQI